MNTSRVRAVVIGLGRHGFRHLQALKTIGVDIVAVCDVQSDQVALALDQYPGAKGYNDYEVLLESERPELVSVVTNGPSHAPITLAAAEHDARYVLCEKPMATSAKDAQSMIKACEAHNVRLAICHARRWDKSYQQLHAKLTDGLIGKLAHFWITCGGGLFAGNGTHYLDLARMLCGSNPISVTAILDKTGTPNPRGPQFQDPGAVALYQFENGMRLVIDMFEDLGVPPRIEIVGTIGRVLIDEIEVRWEMAAREGEDREKPVSHYWLPLNPVPVSAAPLDMIDMLANCLRELLSDDEIRCTGRDGLSSLEMVIGAHISAKQEGATIGLPLSENYESFDIPLT